MTDYKSKSGCTVVGTGTFVPENTTVRKDNVGLTSYQDSVLEGECVRSTRPGPLNPFNGRVTVEGLHSGSRGISFGYLLGVLERCWELTRAVFNSGLVRKCWNETF